MHSDTASQGDFIATKRDVSLEESKQGREQGISTTAFLGEITQWEDAWSFKGEYNHRYYCKEM